MSSVIFQPLLHDPLGWKSSNTTYADAFKWRKYRSTSKDKKISPYGQQYQKQLRKQQQQQQQQFQETNLFDPPATTTGEQINQRATPTKRTEENREGTKLSNRCQSSKSAPAALDQSQISNAENKQRPASNNRETSCGSRALQRSTTTPPAVEEACRPVTSLDVRRSSKEEKEKVVTDPNNDNSRHWLTYPNPKTPQYIIDIKHRLGQLRIPSTLARPTSETNLATEQQQQQQDQDEQQKQNPFIQRSESAITQRPHQQPNADQRHLFDYNLPQTPLDLRAARHRIDKHRYNASIDSYPPRPQTCPVQAQEITKPITSPVLTESKEEPLPPIDTTQPKADAWVNEEEKKPDEYELSTIMIQPIDVDSPSIEQIATSQIPIPNLAQEEVITPLKPNDEKKSETNGYRLPSASNEYKTDSFIAFRNQQRSTTPSNNVPRNNDFNAWVRTASRQERESALKILQDVLTQPIMGYDVPTKPRTVFKQPPVPPPVRTTSCTRKLGRTRNHQRLPCEICEKQMIKHHVWNLARSENFSCPHEAQTIKSSMIQVQSS